VAHDKTPVSIAGTSWCLFSESYEIQTPCEPTVQTSRATGRRVDWRPKYWGGCPTFWKICAPLRECIQLDCL